MIFSDPPFWLFFAVVFAAYLVLPHRWQNRLLLVASYYFYGCWDWRFLSLIFFSTVVDYFVGLKMASTEDERARKRLLFLSLGVNLGLLGVFKYYGFFAESFAGLLWTMGFEADFATLNIILPVGISFYTFQTLSYTFDIYRRELKPTRNFLDFAVFVAFFPQLVAGPIERARNLLPNVTMPRTVSMDLIGRGVVLCLLGLIKKVVIADGISPLVDATFSSPDPSGADILFATYLFAIQIYCDFSGYTDIARGISKMMGFELMRNFAQPYFSTNPQSFWRRWHISLSTWLRDYLYISLGGNRGGETKTYRNLMMTMVLGGLWHGAAWNFVLWGFYQGALLAVHRMFAAVLETPKTWSAMARTGMRGLKLFLFFHLVCYGWLLFRAQSFSQITEFTGKLFTDMSLKPLVSEIASIPLGAIVGIAFILIWDILTEVTKQVRFYERWPILLRATAYALMIYILAFGGSSPTGAFIYFQF
ncbi:MAG: MBOAT family O-acyltransferase [Parvularcula sp.]